MRHRQNAEEPQLIDGHFNKETAVYVLHEMLHEARQKLVLSESVYSGT